MTATRDAPYVPPAYQPDFRTNPLPTSNTGGLYRPPEPVYHSPEFYVDGDMLRPIKPTPAELVPGSAPVEPVAPAKKEKKKPLERLATIASFVSMVPGPIGSIAGVVETGALLATGDYGGAGLAAVGAVLSLVGLGFAAKAWRAGRAAKTAIRVVEQADGVIHLSVNTTKGAVEVIANMAKTGDILTLSKAHIQGAGAGQLGRAGINELKAAAVVFGRQNGVKEVIVQGAARQSGLMYGKVPSPIVIKVN